MEAMKAEAGEEKKATEEQLGEISFEMQVEELTKFKEQAEKDIIELEEGVAELCADEEKAAAEGGGEAAAEESDDEKKD